MRQESSRRAKKRGFSSTARKGRRDGPNFLGYTFRYDRDPKGREGLIPLSDHVHA